MSQEEQVEGFLRNWVSCLMAGQKPGEIKAVWEMVWLVKKSGSPEMERNTWEKK